MTLTTRRRPRHPTPLPITTQTHTTIGLKKCTRDAAVIIGEIKGQKLVEVFDRAIRTAIMIDSDLHGDPRLAHMLPNAPGPITRSPAE